MRDLIGQNIKNQMPKSFHLNGKTKWLRTKVILSEKSTPHNLVKEKKRIKVVGTDTGASGPKEMHYNLRLLLVIIIHLTKHEKRTPNRHEKNNIIKTINYNI